MRIEKCVWKNEAFSLKFLILVHMGRSTRLPYDGIPQYFRASYATILEEFNARCYNPPLLCETSQSLPDALRQYIVST
jgi:hypothetical protein